MTFVTRSGNSGNVPNQSGKIIVNEDQILQKEDVPHDDAQVNDDVRIDNDDNVVESKEEVNPSGEHIIDVPKPVVQKAKASFPNPPLLMPKGLLRKMMRINLQSSSK